MQREVASAFVVLRALALRGLKSFEEEYGVKAPVSMADPMRKNGGGKC